MPKHNLTQGLEQQVTIRNGTYYNKKCSGKEQSEGQACVLCRYTRKALQSRKSRLKGLVSIQPLREAFKIDSGNTTLKAMPDLTLVHLQPNGFEKMRVTLAFQLFGDRVLHGLNFYKDTLESLWGEIDATLSFFT
ncbi:hypothetical protein HPB50_028884 [Hyalomma asiaticum]|nr:hypothetical protein HPB50_028884 [Hyalomma asiaticum]